MKRSRGVILVTLTCRTYCMMLDGFPNMSCFRPCLSGKQKHMLKNNSLRYLIYNSFIKNGNHGLVSKYMWPKQRYET